MEKGLINLLRNQQPAFKRSHLVQACGSAAWSRSLRVFAVHNGRECLGYSDVSATLPRLKVSPGCLGGKGGQNVTDVYRFTSKETLLILFNEWVILFVASFTFIGPPTQPFAQTFASLPLRIIHSLIHSLIHSCSKSGSPSVIGVSIYLFIHFFSLLFS